MRNKKHLECISVTPNRALKETQITSNMSQNAF